MLELEDVVHWLREGEENAAADILAQCEFDYSYVDTGFPFDGGQEIDIYDLRVKCPRRYYQDMTKFKSAFDAIEKAINECSMSVSCSIRSVNFAPKLGSAQTEFPSDREVEKILETVDVPHIKRAWEKAIQRRKTDPDGALTSAKTIIEATCKSILDESKIPYTPSADINGLIAQVLEVLELSPSQHIDKETKRMLGSMCAVVNGIAFLRNRLGDSHGSSSIGEPNLAEISDLAINVAGNISTMLLRISDKQRSQRQNNNPENHL